MPRVPASLTLEVPLPEGKAAPSEFRIFPRGAFTTRNYDIPFYFDDESARLVMDAAKEWGNQFHLDYEHAALTPGEHGAPAACWFDLEVRADGLWAVNAKWTDRAAAALAAREYRYFSPVYFYDDTGRITEFVNAALTNLPATDGMVPLAASRTAPPHLEKKPMKTLLAALRLADSASEADALAALSSVQAFQVAVLSLAGKATHQEALGVLQGFKASHEQVAALTTEVSELKKASAAAELEKAIEEGKQAGKISPGMEPWARTQTPEAIKAFLSVAPKLLPTVTKAPKDKGVENGELTKADLRLAKLTGTDPKLISASRARHGGEIPRASNLFDQLDD